MEYEPSNFDPELWTNDIVYSDYEIEHKEEIREKFRQSELYKHVMEKIKKKEMKK